jgi:hypothetical protein
MMNDNGNQQQMMGDGEQEGEGEEWMMMTMVFNGAPTPTLMSNCSLGGWQVHQGSYNGKRGEQQHNDNKAPTPSPTSRVDLVLMATSPLVNSRLAPTPTVSLSSEVVVFCYLAPAASPGAALLILYD